MDGNKLSENRFLFGGYWKYNLRQGAKRFDDRFIVNGADKNFKDRSAKRIPLIFIIMIAFKAWPQNRSKVFFAGIRCCFLPRCLCFV